MSEDDEMDLQGIAGAELPLWNRRVAVQLQYDCGTEEHKQRKIAQYTF